MTDEVLTLVVTTAVGAIGWFAKRHVDAIDKIDKNRDRLIQLQTDRVDSIYQKLAAGLQKLIHRLEKTEASMAREHQFRLEQDMRINQMTERLDALQAWLDAPTEETTQVVQIGKHTFMVRSKKREGE